MIWPAFQPLVDLRSGHVEGFEVLARWTDDMIGPVGPAEFIPLAERTGLIDQLSRHILLTACTQAAAWPGSFTLAFNFSPLQFQSPALCDTIVETVGSTGFPLERVHIEITEGAVIENEDLAKATILRMKEAGLGLALDDFGTGFASLSRLHAFPFDKLKIDTSFVRTLESDAASRKIVSSVIGLGLSLGMQVVAEGVETPQQSEMLKKLRCSIGQGWHYGRPMTAEEAAKSLAETKGASSVRKVGLDISPYQKLHQLEELYRVAPIGVCFLDTDLVHVSVNERFAAVLGLKPGDMIGKTVVDFMPPESAEAVTEILKRVLQGEAVSLEEFKPAGTDRSCLVINKRVDDEAGEAIGISVVAIDITDKKLIEASLKEMEDHLQHAMELSPNVVWSADESGETTYVGPTLDGALTPVKARIVNWSRRIHPEDLMGVMSCWADHVRTRDDFEMKFRVRFPDGNYRWMLSRARPKFNPDGSLDRWYGMMTEVDHQHALEEKVAALEARLRETRR